MFFPVITKLQTVPEYMQNNVMTVASVPKLTGSANELGTAFSDSLKLESLSVAVNNAERNRSPFLGGDFYIIKGFIIIKSKQRETRLQYLPASKNVSIKKNLINLGYICKLRGGILNRQWGV